MNDVNGLFNFKIDESIFYQKLLISLGHIILDQRDQHFHKMLRFLITILTIHNKQPSTTWPL